MHEQRTWSNPSLVFFAVNNTSDLNQRYKMPIKCVDISKMAEETENPAQVMAHTK